MNNYIKYSLNTPMKRQKLSGLALLSNLTTYWLQETHFKYKDTNRLKRKRRKKIQNKTVIKILLSH